MISPNHVFIVLNEVEENNNTLKMPNADSAKLRHKNAWAELNKTVQRVANNLSASIYIKPSRWSMGQYLYKRFWFELKKDDRQDSNSSVSLSFDKNGLKIYLEWDRKNTEKSSNTLDEHNYWLNSLPSWADESNLDSDKYFIWITNDEDKDKPEPIKLKKILENEGNYNKQVQQQLRNPTYPFRVGQILSKEEVNKTNRFEQLLLSSLEELFIIYDNTKPNVDFPYLEPSNRFREFNNYSTNLKDRIVHEYLFNGKSHRWLDEHLLGIDLDKMTGHQSMNILHYIGLRGKHKGILSGYTTEAAINILAQQELDFGVIIDCLNRLSSEKNTRTLDISSIEENPILTATEKEQIIKSRIGQEQFKKSLLNHEEKCRLCGVMDVRFLIASHIKPWSKSNSVERLDSDNGLLLCPNHDALFDKGYISFDHTGMILISLNIDSNLKLFLNINEQIQIHMNESQKKYMKWHRENIFSFI